MKRIKLNWSKIGIFTIQVIGWFLTILVLHLITFSHTWFTISCIIGLGLGTDITILHILIKTKHENSPYFDPQYAWKYRMLPWIFICLIILCFYWIEALAVLIFLGWENKASIHRYLFLFCRTASNFW